MTLDANQKSKLSDLQEYAKKEAIKDMIVTVPEDIRFGDHD